MEIFRPDRPVDSEKEDKFQRYPFARRIAQIVEEGKYSKSLVIGIYGKWGEGKTSLMNFIQTELEGKVVIINFNPWLFNDQNQLVKSFFESVASAIGKKLKSKKEKVAEIFGEYADSLGSLADLLIPGAKAFAGVGKKFAEKLGKNSIEDLKKKINELIIETNSNFVVLVDDIDRLDVSEIQAVFKLVKLVGDFSRTSYILSFDDDMVASALGPQYAGGDKVSGYGFLEKIIQMPLNLPKADIKALRTYSLTLVNDVLEKLKIQMSDNEISDFVQKFDVAFLPMLKNPRLGVRFANSIGFSTPLLWGEVHISDLMSIEGIKIFFPELYYFIRNNSDVFLMNKPAFIRYDGQISQAEKDKVKKEIENHLTKYGDNQKDKILQIVKGLFPIIKSLYDNYVFKTEDFEQWYREKRLCSAYYFERYFSYVVREGDISDVYFKNLFLDLGNVASSELVKSLEDELNKLKPEDFIFKLQRIAPTFNSPDAIKLATTIACLGIFFSRVPTFLGFHQSRQAATVIYRLLSCVIKTERLALCFDILKSSVPFNFSIDIQKTFRSVSNSWEEPFLEEAELLQTINCLLDRLLEECTNNNLFSIAEETDIGHLIGLFEKANRKKQMEKLLLDQLNLNKAVSLRIIKVFTPTMLSGPRQYKMNFQRKNYTNLTYCIDPNALYQATVEAFDRKEYFPVPNPETDELTDENLVARFQQIHEEEIKSNFSSPSILEHN